MKALAPLLLLLSLTFAQSYLMIVHNPNSRVLTDFQVRAKLPSDLIGKPITIKDIQGNIIPFCYETATGECTTDPAQGNGHVWVRVPSIPTDGETKLIVKVGSNGAIEGDQVFEFYDDFNSYPNGPFDGGSRWVVLTSALYIQDGELYAKENSQRMRSIKQLRIHTSIVLEMDIQNYYETGDYACYHYYLGIDDGTRGVYVQFRGRTNNVDSIWLATLERPACRPLQKALPYTSYRDWYLLKLILDPSNREAIAIYEKTNGERIYIREAVDVPSYGKLNLWVAGCGDHICGITEVQWIRVRKYAPLEPTVTFQPYTPPAPKLLLPPSLPKNLTNFLQPILATESVYLKALSSKGLVLKLLETPLTKAMKEMSKVKELEILTLSLYSKYKDLNKTLASLNQTLSSIDLQQPNLTKVFNAYAYVNLAEAQLSTFNSTYYQIEDLANGFNVTTCKGNATKSLLELLEASKSLPMFLQVQGKIKKDFGSVDNLIKCLVQGAQMEAEQNFKYLKSWAERVMKRSQESLSNSQAALDVLIALITSK